MTAATAVPAAATSAEREEIRHIADLVFVRELLRERGAPPAELRACDAVIARARQRLAAAARAAASQYAAAA